MKDEDKTNAQLIEELKVLRQRIAELEVVEADHKQIQEALQIGEEMFRQLAENIHEVFFVRDLAQNRMIYISPAYDNIWGYSRERIYQDPKAFLDAVHPEDREKVIAALEKQNLGKFFNEEYRIIRLDGAIRWIRARTFPVRDETGQIYRVAGIAEDITKYKQVEEALRQVHQELEEMLEVNTADLQDTYKLLKEQMAQRQEAEKKLRQSEERLRAQYDGFPIPTYTWHRVEDNFVLIDYNYAAEIITKGNIINYLGKTVSEMYGDTPEIQADFQQCLKEKILIRREMLYRFQSTGEEKYLAVNYAFVPPDLIMVNTEDISERKQVEAQLRTSLKEKEVLLREIHHRVKNNLQVVSSLLMFQTRYIDDQDIIKLFKESRNRVKSMALIHEKLYQSKEMARVHSAEYIRSLTSYLFHSYVAQKRGILLKLKVDGVSLNIDQGVLCGLIINELISNSLQHAFPIDKGDRPPEVYVSLCLDNNDHVILVVGDNGIGFPPNLDFHKTESLGLQLVLMLVEQLEGVIELDKQAGTRFEINFVLQ